MAASDVAAARAAYQQAGELARRIGAPEALARAALGLGSEFTSGIADPVEIGLLEDALVALGGADSRLRARVLARLAKALLFTGQADRKLQLSEEAVGLARRLGDPATLAAVLYDHHLAIWGWERAEVAAERLAVATEVVGLAEGIGDWAMALRGRGLRRPDLLGLGDLAGFDADLAAAERTAKQLRQLHYHWQLPFAHATRALLAGRFAQAEEQAAQGLAIGRRAGDQAAGVVHATVVGTLRFMQGRLGETVEVLEDLSARFPAMPVYRASLAGALAEAGYTEQAQAEVEHLAAEDLAALTRDFSWSVSLATLAAACHHLGDTTRAAKVSELLEPYADRNIATGRVGVLCLGPAAYYLGLLDLTLGQPEQAAGRFAHAATLAGRIQARPMAAMSREGQARALLALGRPDDRQQAQALLEEVSRHRRGARHPRARRTSQRPARGVGRTNGAGLAGRPDRPRGRGPTPDRHRPQQPGHRPGAVHQPQHRAAPRQQHLHQDRGGQPRRGRRLRHPEGSGRIAASCYPAAPARRTAPAKPQYAAMPSGLSTWIVVGDSTPRAPGAWSWTSPSLARNAAHPHRSPSGSGSPAPTARSSTSRPAASTTTG